MRPTICQTVSGEVTGTNGRTTLVVEPDATIDRWVNLVLDDSNWRLSICFERVSKSALARSAICSTGRNPVWLAAGQGLYIHAALAAGGAGTTWNLSVTVCEHAA